MISRPYSMALASAWLLTACGPAEVKTLDNDDQRASYAIGMDIGTNLKEVSEIIDVPALMQGLSDAIADDSLLLSPADAQTALQEFGARAQAVAGQARSRVGDENRAAGEAFLATNGQRDGVTTTSSGLQYEIITETAGPKPSPADQVRVHYAGTFTDGTPFESTYDSGRPAEFAVGGVISGWTEALQLMSVGSKYRLFIPGDLAYGESGSRSMEPNKTLIFEVELLEIL